MNIVSWWARLIMLCGIFLCVPFLGRSELEMYCAMLALFVLNLWSLASLLCPWCGQNIVLYKSGFFWGFHFLISTRCPHCGKSIERQKDELG